MSFNYGRPSSPLSQGYLYQNPDDALRLSLRQVGLDPTSELGRMAMQRSQLLPMMSRLYDWQNPGRAGEREAYNMSTGYANYLLSGQGAQGGYNFDDANMRAMANRALSGGYGTLADEWMSSGTNEEQLQKMMALEDLSRAGASPDIRASYMRMRQNDWDRFLSGYLQDPRMNLFKWLSGRDPVRGSGQGSGGVPSGQPGTAPGQPGTAPGQPGTAPGAPANWQSDPTLTQIKGWVAGHPAHMGRQSFTNLANSGVSYNREVGARQDVSRGFQEGGKRRATGVSAYNVWANRVQTLLSTGQATSVAEAMRKAAEFIVRVYDQQGITSGFSLTGGGGAAGGGAARAY